MPVWHELTKAARDAGQLVLLGVIQEQHPDRCELFAQWKGFDWTILHDPINLLKTRAVPMFVAIDESGVIVDSDLRTSELASFLARPATEPTQGIRAPGIPANARTNKSLGGVAVTSNDPSDWIDAADRQILWGDLKHITTAIDCYKKAAQLAPDDGAAQFRLGVALRMRCDSGLATADDFQAAVDAWGRALDADPNHYIYRRRIQQYGPRLAKPYPFYDWVQQARREVAARGDEPHELVVEPVGAELAQPTKELKASEQAPDQPDPGGRILRDLENFVDETVTVVPGTIAQGDAVRVHLRMRPTRGHYWNNEAEPLRLWINVPEGWQAESPSFEAPQPIEPESREQRRLDFELQSPATTSVDAIHAYALYYVCDEQSGQCLYRRKDIEIPIRFRE